VLGIELSQERIIGSEIHYSILSTAFIFKDLVVLGGSSPPVQSRVPETSVETANVPMALLRVYGGNFVIDVIFEGLNL